MIQISSENKEQELKTYCQKWLSYLADSDFDSASSMIDSPNCYGLSWGKQEIIEALINYFGETMEFHIQKVDLSECSPCYLERSDGGLLYEFNLPANGKLTDLTVQFEFNQKPNNKFEVIIHDIHVL